jgi:hypothetical protein
MKPCYFINYKEVRLILVTMLQLKKYNGHKDICPSCGQRSFTPYVDEAGNILDVNVGRCDRESKCGYHQTPKQFFIEHPDMSIEDWRDSKPRHINLDVPKKELCLIPMELIDKSVTADRDSALQVYFHTHLSKADADLLDWSAEEYRVGVTKEGATIFPQIDVEGRCRTAKIMRYDSTTGHRLKGQAGAIDWVHSRMKKSGDLPQDWELTQCLFGEHLLKKHPHQPVAVVESEKTAVICSTFLKEFVWVATGGKSQLNERLDVLKGRKVLVFPDSDGYEEWCYKAEQFHDLDINVSDLVHLNATKEERERQIDLADLIIEERINLK